MAKSSWSKSLAETTFARADQAGNFKRCCLASGCFRRRGARRILARLKIVIDRRFNARREGRRGAKDGAA
jgi:hypothetical protein